MVKTVAPPSVLLPPSTTTAPSVASTDNAADPTDSDSGAAEASQQAERNAASTKADAFEGAARQSTQNQTASLANALSASLSSADAANLLGSFAKDASLGDLFGQIGAADASTSLEALQNLSVPQLDQLLEGVLGQLVELAQSLGQPLSADALTLLATLNGQPASLLDAHTDATTLWRAMALSNKPLSVLTLAATGHDIDEQSGLKPNTAYRVLGTFLDGNQERQVRLASSAPHGAPVDEEAMQAQALTVPFAALQRAILLALIGDPRIDMPYAHEIDEAAGPGAANCCMFAHATGATRNAASVSQRPTSLSEPRCRSCAFARQLCLPES